MSKRWTMQGVRKGLMLLLGVSCLVMPACASDDTPDSGFFTGETESEVADNVGTSRQAMIASLCSDPSTATIVGTAGDDYLLGTSGVDIIFGLGGNDIILGKGGDDILCGGAGNDNIQGGDGNDRVEGGAGYNWLRGDAGNDIVLGGDDGNELQGNDGDDEVVGGAGHDTVYGGGDDDVLRGGGGDDDMYGMDGDDKLFGDDGDDYMVGGVGDDCMDGGADDDRLRGEAGNDCLNGGDGVDQVACGDGADSYENGEWDFSSCETVGACNCDGFCPCNTPNSFFEQFVTGQVTLNPGANGFCNNSASTSLAVVFPPGAIAAGGEAIQSGSGFWACESAGGQPGDVGFLPNIPEAEARFCGDLVRDALMNSGVNPNAQCGPW